MGETYHIAQFASCGRTEVSTFLTAESPGFSSKLLADSKHEALLFICHPSATIAVIDSIAGAAQRT